MAVVPGVCWRAWLNCWLPLNSCNFSMKFGAHMSTGGGVWKALERGRSINCESVQIFVKSNMRWFGQPHSPQDVALFAKEMTANTFASVFGHTGYLINLGAPASNNW